MAATLQTISLCMLNYCYNEKRLFRTTAKALTKGKIMG